ncbi:MAG: hypothetical protein ACRDO1_02055 [Nocardioidaceae bacterium]|nr:hypothetical protein [Propionibacteriales bacterium]
MTYLALLADELQQLAGLLRASGDDVAQASREVFLAPADRLGTPAVDAAGDELVGTASTSLGRLAVAVDDVEQLLGRLAAASGDASGGTR